MAAKKEPTAAAVVDKSDKKKALEGAMQQIERLYGKGSIMRSFGFGDLEITPDPAGIPRVVQGILYDEI